MYDIKGKYKLISLLDPRGWYNAIYVCRDSLGFDCFNCIPGVGSIFVGSPAVSLQLRNGEIWVMPAGTSSYFKDNRFKIVEDTTPSVHWAKKKQFVVGDDVTLGDARINKLLTTKGRITSVSATSWTFVSNNLELQIDINGELSKNVNGALTKFGSDYYIEHTTNTIASLDSQFKLDPTDMYPDKKESPCDCGSLVAYKSMAAVYHSDWCKSRKS